MVPTIQQIIGDGPDMTAPQRDVFEMMERHPNRVFRMSNYDLKKLNSLLQPPDCDRSATSGDGRDGTDSNASSMRLSSPSDTLKDAVITLHGREKIGSVKIHGQKYYGSHEAVTRANDANVDPAVMRLKATREAIHQYSHVKASKANPDAISDTLKELPE